MTLFTKCPTCRRKVLYTRRWSYIAPKISPSPITSINECCHRCFQDIKYITINSWSTRHYIKHGILRLKEIAAKIATLLP